MQIKTQHGRTYLLRSVPDPERRRSRQLIVGACDAKALDLPPEALEGLTPDEANQWITHCERVRSAVVAMPKEEMEAFAGTLARFVAGLAVAGELIDTNHEAWIAGLKAAERAVQDAHEARHPGLGKRLLAAVRGK